jgi:hypothetical protein
MWPQYLVRNQVTFAAETAQLNNPTIKNAVFWDVAPCRSCVNRRIGRTYRLHLQGRKSASDEPAWASGHAAAHDKRKGRGPGGGGGKKKKNAMWKVKSALRTFNIPSQTRVSDLNPVHSALISLLHWIRKYCVRLSVNSKVTHWQELRLQWGTGNSVWLDDWWINYCDITGEPLLGYGTVNNLSA